MNRIPFYSALLVQLLLAAGLGWWAAGISPPLGALAFAATLVASTVLMHNYDGVLTRRILARDDELLMHFCESGGTPRIRWIYRRLPGQPRCRVCLVPFGGIGRWLGVRPSRKNANFCQSCLEASPLGGYEMRAGVLFADLRGFTSYSETHGPAAAAELLSRFYALASDALTEDDALVELVGDEVMALYLPMFPSLAQDAPRVMIDAARRLSRAVDAAEGLLPVGVGLHIGPCMVGNVGKGGEKDFTAVGDVVNTAARLQAHAGAGEIVVSDDVRALAGPSAAQARPTSLALKGKAELFAAHVLTAAG